MKTDNTLLEKMLSDENINEAYKQVKRNKVAPGIDGMTVSELKGYLEENLDVIKEQIRTRKYKPSPVKRVEIPKDNGGTRNLGVPTVIDRLIQQAIVQILTRFQSGSVNISPTPWPSAVMRSILILYFLTKIFFTASARAFAILSFTSILPSGEAYPLITTLVSGCFFI